MQKPINLIYDVNQFSLIFKNISENFICINYISKT